MPTTKKKQSKMTFKKEKTIFLAENIQLHTHKEVESEEEDDEGEQNATRTHPHTWKAYDIERKTAEVAQD